MNEVQGDTASRLPYRACYGPGLRIGAVASVIFFVWMLFVARDDQGKLASLVVWHTRSWLFRVGLVLGLIAIPGVLMEMFLESVVFDAHEIRRRNIFGVWRRFSYSMIKGLDVFPGEFARVSFADGSKLIVRAAMADLRLVERIIRNRSRMDLCQPEDREMSHGRRRVIPKD